MGRRREAGVVELPKGVNRIVRKSGRVVYYWHPGRGTASEKELRAEWCRLPDDPGSPAFWDAIQKAQNGPQKHLGGITRMVDAYMGSPKFLGLAEATRRDYERYLAELQRRFGDLEPRDIEPHHCAAIRDSFAATPSKADHFVAVIRALYAWGVERGFSRTNPAIGISTIAKVEPYEPWPQWAWEIVPLMRRELRIACNLALYTGQRLGDVLRMQLGHIEDGRVRVKQSKTGKELVIRLHSALRPVIEECRQAGTIYLVARENGSPFTVDQFHAMWGREMRRQDIGRIRREGYVFHGLRKSAVCALLECGCTTKEVAAVTGHSLNQIEHYSRQADQLRLGDAAVGRWEG